jgi:hypothetical protein
MAKSGAAGSLHFDGNDFARCMPQYANIDYYVQDNALLKIESDDFNDISLYRFSNQGRLQRKIRPFPTSLPIKIRSTSSIMTAPSGSTRERGATFGGWAVLDNNPSTISVIPGTKI